MVPPAFDRTREDVGNIVALEHEVRSLTNPLYARPLVNRNPSQSNIGYERGRDAFGG